MTPCFADTFFFLALLNADDPHHAQARELNHINRPVVTSFWVMLELADHLCDARNRHLIAEVLREIHVDARYELISVDQGVLDEAIKLYAERSDKDWSLTDCTSFVIMRARGITDAITGDHHFEQAGFQALLK